MKYFLCKLLATRINRYLDSVSTFDNLEIDLIRFPSNVLRRSNQDLTDMVESIRENGLLQPIIVRPRGERFEVVAGNRRLEACKRLKHRRIKAMVVELDDKSAYEIAITENVQRKTLDPLEEASAFKKYCDEYGWGSQSELAKKIGKSQEYVSHRIRLLDLPNEVKNALTQKEITLAIAEELVWLKNDGAKKKIAMECLSQKMPMQEVRNIVKAVNSENEVHGSRRYVSLDSNEASREKEFSKTISESILILRIALVRMDELATKTKDPSLRQTIVSKRIALHSLIDELITMKRNGFQMPQLVAKSK
jgi:ParB family transcriptional regulator, chromosome partitioning protein